MELFVSEKGDQFLVHHAQRSYYEALLEAGVRIYLYRAPYVLHAKHFTIDEEVAVLGSSNMDMRSFSLNMEVSVMLLGAEAVDSMRSVESSYREMCRELTLQDWLHRPACQVCGQRGAVDRDAAVIGTPQAARLRPFRSIRENGAQGRENTEGLGPDLFVLVVRRRIRCYGPANAEAQRSAAVAVGVDDQSPDHDGQISGGVQRKVADRS